LTTITINGVQRTLRSEPDTPLLYVLRDELGLNAAKYGCGLAQCGACTVLVDGQATFSCITPVALLDGRAVTTVEGLGGEAAPGALQQAFIEEQAAQCGYCIAGMMMRAQGLLLRNPRPSEAQVRDELEPNLCRCGAHMRIIRAVLRAAATNHVAEAGGGQ
jgi:nicotinate dehydrogenase subunit A